MPSLSQLPGDLSREKFIRALIRLGFEVDKRGGDGSHYKVICPNGKIFTVQYKLHRKILYQIIKEIKLYTGITWEDIKKEL